MGDDDDDIPEPSGRYEGDMDQDRDLEREVERDVKKRPKHHRKLKWRSKSRRRL